MELGFIGLGNIGGAIARNLMEDGHSLWVHDTDPARGAELVEAGAKQAESAAGVAEHAGVTFLSLPNPDVVDAVAEEWLRGAAAGSCLVDLSTNSPARIRALAARVEAAGHALLDAPLTGGAMGARARALVFMVGGEAEAFARVKPVLDGVGRATFHMGGSGAGMVAKLVNSCVAFTTTCASLEALAMGAKAGVDLRALVEVVRTAGAGNFYIDRAVEGIGRRGAAPEFALELAAKDSGLILDLARESGVPTPLASAVGQVLVTAVAAGLGKADWSELPAIVERQADLAFELGPTSEAS